MTVPEIATLMAATGALIVSLAGAFVSVWNAVHIASVHTIVNSQAAKFERLAGVAGFSEGVASVGSSPTAKPAKPRQTPSVGGPDDQGAPQH